FVLQGEREVGYWLGREFWGRGIATQALTAFLEQVTERPLFAHVAKHNLSSRRVLEKCAFAVVGEGSWTPGGEAVAEWVLRLD
ncbi:MAG: N-acetyltransferase, partial [Chloroflexi bacterium]